MRLRVEHVVLSPVAPLLSMLRHVVSLLPGWLRIRYDQTQILNFALSRDESNFQLPRHWPLLMYLLKSVLFVHATTVE